MIAAQLEDLVEAPSPGDRVAHPWSGRATRETRPGLILADIQLADGSAGLDAVNELLTSLRCPSS